MAFDPAAIERATDQLGGLSNVAFARSAFEARKGSDVLLILTEWQEFKKMDLRVIREAPQLPIVIDGRNLLIAEGVEAAGFVSYSMGRQAAPGRPVESVAARAQVAAASL